tara:strand:- start:129 stop:632 length:504 start_codon:yes stop_codon:yes gene_type:complete
MLLKLLVLFIVLPLLDLWLLFTLADGVLSFGATVGLVLATGIIGASLAKQQGLAAWKTFNAELGRGALPADTMLDGVLILLAGTVLITPGLITDAVGLALLVPPVRRLVRKFLVQRLTSRIKFHTVFSAHSAGNPGSGFAADDATVIDAEFQRRDTNGASSSDPAGS